MQRVLGDRVEHPVDMTPERLHAIAEGSAAKGCRFFGILGGEPLLLPWLPDFFAAHPSLYFQLFTNGQFLTTPSLPAARSPETFPR